MTISILDNRAVLRCDGASTAGQWCNERTVIKLPALHPKTGKPLSTDAQQASAARAVAATEHGWVAKDGQDACRRTHSYCFRPLPEKDKN